MKLIREREREREMGFRVYCFLRKELREGERDGNRIITMKGVGSEVRKRNKIKLLL